jgi:hypothetical protein
MPVGETTAGTGTIEDPKYYAVNSSLGDCDEVSRSVGKKDGAPRGHRRVRLIHLAHMEGLTIPARR